MRDFWIYDMYINENYFEIDLINPVTDRRVACYVLYDKKENTDMLHGLLGSSLLISEGNHNYGDIILNYIWYNKDIIPKEIYGLSLAIKDNSVDDFGFYKNLGVDSIDLLKLSDYVDLKEEDMSSDRLPFKIKGVDVIDFYFHKLCMRVSSNYKKSLQFRKDITRASLTPKGREEFDNFIFEYNVRNRDKNKI